MTLARLRKRVGLVAGGLGLVIAVAVTLRLFGEDEAYGTVKDLSPLVIAILAAFLASSFQERATFVQSLRSLWSQLIDAKNELMEYTRTPSPSSEQYAYAFKQLSKAIDEMRGVYRNVGEDDNYRGYFPYEPLHDMRRSLKKLEQSPDDADAAEAAQREISAAWDALRPSFLAEFAPPEPTTPIVLRKSVDERQSGIAPAQR
jgi:hypothetical protein